MLKRKTPLQRNSGIKRSGYIRRSSKKRLSQIRPYARDAAYYLAKHPFCQITIALCEFDEAAVLRHAVLHNVRNCSGIFYQGQLIPIATEIHHRNKRDGERLLDQRWWMATCRKKHDWVEDHKNDARALGFLLPINADKDGRWGGNQALTTPEFMALKGRAKA